MQTLTKWLEKQKELCQKATAGPWVQSTYNKHGDIYIAPQKDRHCHIIIVEGQLLPILQSEQAWNARFVANSRLSLPQALAIIQAILDFADFAMDGPDRDRINQVATDILNPPAEKKE